MGGVHSKIIDDQKPHEGWLKVRKSQRRFCPFLSLPMVVTSKFLYCTDPPYWWVSHFPTYWRYFPLWARVYARLGFLLYLKTWATLSPFLSALHSAKPFREKASFVIHLPPCLYFPSSSQNSFFLASLAVHFKRCVLIFLSSILVVSMERITQDI